MVFIAMAAPRRGAPCSPAVGAPSPAHSPAWKQSRAAFALRRRRYVFLFVCFFGLPLAESEAEEVGGRGRTLILDWQNPVLPNPTPHFVAPRWIGGGVFPTRSSTKGAKVPALGPGSRVGAGNAPLTLTPPPPGERSPRGWTYFLAATPGNAASLANGERHRGRNGRIGLICNEFCPFTLGEKILIV